MKSTLDIRTRFTLLLAWIALSFVVYGAWSIQLLREVRVNGPIYQRIAQSKDLVADILPPPEYILESYLVAHELQAAANKSEQEALVRRLQALKADFDQRHQYWQGQALEADLQQAFLRDSYNAAVEFYALAQNEFVPAIQHQDKEAATGAMQRMRAAYERHRQAIDRVVEMANKRAEADEGVASNRVDAASWELPAVLVLALVASIGVALHILRSLFRQLGGDPAVAAGLAHRIATGDLTVGIDLRQGDKSSLLYAMQVMRDKLAQLVAHARNSAETISSASSQIAVGNQDLASRTSEQATSLEQTASSMQGLTEVVTRNADRALQANELAANAGDTVRRGRDAVAQVMQTMETIDASSQRITDIIGVIDSIAFQTNILALNAAVEAARAGEQGRGFAVVATEVRTLAQRSHAAALEIKQLIGDSVERVKAGSRLAELAGAAMQEVVGSIGEVVSVVHEISAASRHQSGEITQLHQSMRLMDGMTQQNAALVEEAAAAADAMHGQAAQLVDVVSVFRLGVPV